MPKHIFSTIATKVCVIMCALPGISCSSHPEPIVDTKGMDMTQYETDLEECRSYNNCDAELNPGENMETWEPLVTMVLVTWLPLHIF